jgi:hypothetical protein
MVFVRWGGPGGGRLQLRLATMSKWQAEFERFLTQCAGRAFGELRDTSDGGLRAGVAPEFSDVLFRPCAALPAPIQASAHINFFVK